MLVFIDVNECNTNAHNCHANADCNNHDGSFTCLCKPGHSGSGSSCDDINECEIANSCDLNATCVNAAGSYACTCNTGYNGTGIGLESCIG